MTGERESFDHEVALVAVACSSPQRPPQLIGRLQRRHQRFGGHLDPHLGQGDRQPYRFLVVQDLVDCDLRLAF